MLQLFNSLTQKKEIFKSIKPKEVSLYVCGITPYDTTHLGHAFTYVSFDVLVRYLKFKGYKVNYVQNITDIDDDILKKAREAKQDWRKLGQFWTEKFVKDMKTLNVISPTHFVKATDSIDKMIEIINKLLKTGFAYRNNGNIYFDVSKDKNFGKLSKYNRKQMQILLKERGGDPKDPNKKNPLDFILWQKSKTGEPSWKAPFGDGRPGWHIECSAMVHEYLGAQIDIHGGGKDLIYPHHESEIVQSENFSGKSPFARFWMHSSMVLYCGEKMAKSLGNLVMVSDLLKKYTANDLRWYLLTHHYKEPWEYMECDIEESRFEVSKIKKALNQGLGDKKISRSYVIKFEEIMDNDLDTPTALKYISKLAKEGKIATAHHLLNLLGFDFEA